MLERGRSLWFPEIASALNLTWMFASPPSAGPRSLVGLLVDLLARPHFDRQSYRSGFRVHRRTAIAVARPD